jgi:hypothetical protein
MHLVGRGCSEVIEVLFDSVRAHGDVAKLTLSGDRRPRR